MNLSYTLRKSLFVMCSALPLLLICLSTLTADELAPEFQDKTEAPVAPLKQKGIIAEVGPGHIDFDTILELWQPTWRRIMLKCQLGKLSSQEANNQLQLAWDKSMNAVVKEEIFFREAVRQMDLDVEKWAKNEYQRQRSGAGGGDSYSAILRTIKNKYIEHIDEQVRSNIESATEHAGGVEELQKTIARQGSNWEDWKSRLRRKMLVQRHLSLNIPLTGIADPSPADIRKYYHENKALFRKPGHATFRHIFISFDKRGGEDNARSVAAELFQKLTGSEENFEKTAILYSDDPVSSKLGGLDPLPKLQETPESLAPKRQAWLEELRSATADLKPNELGPVMLSNHGCHLIYMLTHLPGTMIPFQECQDNIMERLKGKKRERLISRHYATLRDEVLVKIIKPTYPANYSWDEVRKRR